MGAGRWALGSRPRQRRGHSQSLCWQAAQSTLTPAPPSTHHLCAVNPSTQHPAPSTQTPTPKHQSPNTRHPEPKTQKPEPRTHTQEPKTKTTMTLDPRGKTQNPKPKTQNPGQKTQDLCSNTGPRLVSVLVMLGSWVFPGEDEGAHKACIVSKELPNQ